MHGRERSGHHAGRRDALRGRCVAAAVPRVARDLAQSPGHALTVAALHAAGGIRGALLQTAEPTFNALDRDQSPSLGAVARGRPATIRVRCSMR